MSYPDCPTDVAEWDPEKVAGEWLMIKEEYLSHPNDFPATYITSREREIEVCAAKLRSNPLMAMRVALALESRRVTERRSSNIVDGVTLHGLAAYIPNFDEVVTGLQNLVKDGCEPVPDDMICRWR